MIELNLYGEVYEWNTEDLIWNLNKHQDEDVTINIDSVGGDVFSGLRLCNAIENHKGKVTAKCGIVVASIASVIASVCDEILVNKNTFFMVHKAWGVAVGNAEDMDSVGHLLSLADERIKDIISGRAVDASKINEWFSKDTWFSCQEMLDNFKGVFMDSAPNDYKDAVLNSASKITYAKLENKPEALMELMDEIEAKDSENPEKEEEKQEPPQDSEDEEKPQEDEHPEEDEPKDEAPDEEEEKKKEEEEKKAQAKAYVDSVMAKANAILNG